MTRAMTEESSLRSLVDQARAGSRDAFERLVEAYRDRLRSVVNLQLGELGEQGGALDAEEVLQETIARAFESLHRYEWQGEGSFYRWLCGISRNVTRKLAEAGRRTRPLEIPERVPAPGVSPSRALRRSERFERLEACLARLSPEYREVLRLSRLERLKVREIALRMDRSEYAVKHLMARAVRQLRDLFGDTESLHLPDRRLEVRGEGDDGRE